MENLIDFEDKMEMALTFFGPENKTIYDAYSLAKKALDQKNHVDFKDNMNFLRDRFSEQPKAIKLFVEVLYLFSPNYADILKHEAENPKILRTITFEDPGTFAYRANCYQDQNIQNNEQNNPTPAP